MLSNSIFSIFGDMNQSIYQYSSNKTIDMKLLYVAMTRALHELTILYNENITLLLNDNLRKDNTLKKLR